MIKFDEVFSRVGWAAIISVCVYIGSSVDKAQSFMSSIKTDVAVIRVELTNSKDDVREIKTRVDGVEKRVQIIEATKFNSRR